MNEQLESIKEDFLTAQDRLHQLASRMPDDLWSERPQPGRWSASECVAHLNLTSSVYQPILSAALVRAEQLPAAAGTRYRRDLIGWMLWKTMGPPVRIRTSTSADFIPGRMDEPAALIQEFDRLQQEQIQYVERADGLPLNNVRVASPFNSKVTYNLFSCLSILPRHQHRHLWQAEMAVQELQKAARTIDRRQIDAAGGVGL